MSNYRIIPRHDTKANWEINNPILLKGEIGNVDDNPNLYKIGNGTSRWNDLPFRGYNGTITNEMGDDENSVMSQKAVTKSIKSIMQSTGISNIPIFDETKDYAIGDIVNYEGRLLKFVRYHSAGPMSFTEVTSVTVMDTIIVQETGADEEVVMSQNAVSRELARTSLARIDDIVNSATIIDGVELEEPDAIVYVKDQKVFAARKGSEFKRYWAGYDAYMTSEGEIQKDKLYTFNGAVYCWDSVSESLVPSYSLLEAKTPTQIRTGYSDDGVSIDLFHDEALLWSDTIEPATKERAGVMSAADKKRLDEMRDSVVFTGATVDEETEMLVLNRVDDETLVLDEVGCSLPGDITKVSQLENDKGYLTGAVEDESIILNND